MKDRTKPGDYKIGLTNNVDYRSGELNASSSTNSIEVIKKFETFDKYFAESIIHKALNPFRIELKLNKKMSGFI